MKVRRIASDRRDDPRDIRIKDRCGPTRKARYRSKGAALEALASTQRARVECGDHRRRESRAYFCRYCLGFHLSSEPQRIAPQGRRADARLSDLLPPEDRSMSISTSVSGSPSAVKDQLQKYGEQFASTDGENAQTREGRKLSAAASSAFDKLLEGQPDSASVSGSISGSESESGGGYLNISYSVSGGAQQPTAAGTHAGATSGSTGSPASAPQS